MNIFFKTGKIIFQILATIIIILAIIIEHLSKTIKLNSHYNKIGNENDKNIHKRITKTIS